VLVANDGGPAGEKALTAIAAWLQQTAAEVHVVHVLKPGAIHETVRAGTLHGITPASTSTGTPLHAEEPLAILAEDRSQAIEAARTLAAAEIRAMAARHVGGYPVTPHVVVGSEAAHEIVKLASVIGADLIAIGAHGRGGVSHALLGSVAEAVVREAAVPVLLVGPRVA